jgi:hypothetical protein
LCGPSQLMKSTEIVAGRTMTNRGHANAASTPPP